VKAAKEKAGGGTISGDFVYVPGYGKKGGKAESGGWRSLDVKT